VACASVLATSLIVPVFSVNRWDAFEYFTPLLTEAHAQWLRGSFPFWNFHQHLGEPILAQGQAGVFYLPYTVAYALLRLLHLSLERFTLIIFLMHLPWAAIGWFRLMRQWSVRPIFAFCVALSACFSGFLLLISSVWGQMMPVFSWLPWILLGIVKTLERPGLSVSSVGLILSLSAAAGIGYPQTLVYTWVWAGLFALLYTAVVLRSIGKISALAVPAAVAILFSMPTLLPMAQQFLASIRVSGFNESVFLENSVHPASLLSLFSPSLQLPNGFLPHRGTLVFFQGAWLVPVMVLAAGRFSTERRRLFFVLSGLAALFVVFALGQHGFVYPFTRFIPIWGSFRWPYKFLIFGNAALIAAGGLALEAWAQSPARLRIALSVVAAIVTAVLVFVFPGSEKLVLAGIFGTLAFLPFVPAKWATNLFALFVVITWNNFILIL
jgi:hypothetical protein